MNKESPEILLLKVPVTCELFNDNSLDHEMLNNLLVSINGDHWIRVPQTTRLHIIMKINLQGK